MPGHGLSSELHRYVECLGDRAHPKAMQTRVVQFNFVLLKEELMGQLCEAQASHLRTSLSKPLSQANVQHLSVTLEEAHGQGGIPIIDPAIWTDLGLRTDGISLFFFIFY